MPPLCCRRRGQRIFRGDAHGLKILAVSVATVAPVRRAMAPSNASARLGRPRPCRRASPAIRAAVS